MHRARFALAATLALWLIPHAASPLPTPAADGCVALAHLYPSALAVAPDGALLVGSGQELPQDPAQVFHQYQGQVYRSTDPAHTCFLPLAAHPLPTLVQALLVPPGHPAWLLAGGGNVKETSTGLFLSQDKGRTWRNALTSLHLRLPVAPRSLHVAPDGTLVLAYICLQTTSQEVLVACGTGLATSRDGGLSWQSLQPPPGTTVLEVAVLRPHRLVAITYKGTRLFPNSFSEAPLLAFASDDVGASWQPRTIPSTGSQLFGSLWGVPWAGALLISYSDVPHKLTQYRSLDSGRRWTQTQYIALQKLFHTFTLSYIGLQATHIILRQDYQELYRSADDGATWTRLFPPPHTPFMTAFFSYVYSMTAAPDGRTAYFTASTGGGAHLYCTRDGGLTWQPLN